MEGRRPSHCSGQNGLLDQTEAPKNHHGDTENVKAAFRTTVLLAIVLLPAVLWAAEETAAAVPSDPVIDAVFACHSKYVEDYTSIANTASSIADRASAQCKGEMDAYERHALSLVMERSVDPV